MPNFKIKSVSFLASLSKFPSKLARIHFFSDIINKTTEHVSSAEVVRKKIFDPTKLK